MAASPAEPRPVVDTHELSRQLRPAWTPLNIGLMVFFFVVGLWPIGLLMIAYMSYGREMGIDLSNWAGAKGTGSRMMSAAASRATPKTGNAAFDEWRESEMARLAEERRKLEEAKAEFDAFLREKRKDKDREEFEAFKRQRSETVDGTATPSRGDAGTSGTEA